MGTGPASKQTTALPCNLCTAGAGCQAKGGVEADGSAARAPTCTMLARGPKLSSPSSVSRYQKRKEATVMERRARDTRNAASWELSVGS